MAGDADERGSKERPLVIDAVGHQDTEEERAEANTKQQRASEVERWTLYFAQLSAWATFALVIVGAGGIIAAIWTLKVIKKQGDHMARQVTLMERQTNIIQQQTDLQTRAIDLQERQMVQWVKYNKWHSWFVLNEGHKTNAWPAAHLHIKLEIENTTAFPLTLPDSRISLTFGEFNKRRIEFRVDTILLPNTPQTVDFHGWPLSAEQVELFYVYGIPIQVEGDLSYIGVLGKLTPQVFCGQLNCLASGTTFEEETPQKPQQS